MTGADLKIRRLLTTSIVAIGIGTTLTTGAFGYTNFVLAEGFFLYAVVTSLGLASTYLWLGDDS